jgi:mono/diheme cytochrome c family protein
MFRQFRIRTVLFVAALLQTAALIGGDSPKFPQEQQQFFEGKVHGVLKQHCIKCHSGKAPKGGLSLTERSHILNGGESGPAVSLTDPESSLLASAVRFDGPEMPPAGRMSQTDIDTLLKWIELKLPWSESVPAIEAPPEHGPPQVNDETRQFWSFRPVQKSDRP